MKTYLAKDTSVREFYSFLTSSVAPRPICFASTLDADGNPNLAPFSFFNIFGSKPPLLVFSPLRRMRNNTTKDTLENILVTKEVVINVVNYDMVQQMSLSSCEYPTGTNEFIKSGFTPIESDLVKPFRVKESPVQLECKVLEVKSYGDEGGGANLIICEVLAIHINSEVLDEDNNIDPHKIDLVARMGLNYYSRASGDAVFEVPKPNTHLGIGIDQLPEKIRNSTILSGNDLGILGNYSSIPDTNSIEVSTDYKEAFADIQSWEEAQYLAKKMIEANEVDLAWKALFLHNSPHLEFDF